MRWLVLVSLAGCTGSVEDSTVEGEVVPLVDTAPDVDHATDAWLRAVHLAPDLALPCDHDDDPNTPDGKACLGLYVAPSPIPLNDVPFPAGASTGFALPVVPGIYDVELRPWGADPASAAVGTVTATLAPSEGRTVVSYGLQIASTFHVVTIPTDLRPPAAGTARIVVFHANNALTALPLDVVLDGVTEWNDLAFGSAGAAVTHAAGADVSFGVSVDGDAAPEYASTLDLEDGAVLDVFLFDTGQAPAPIVALVHTLPSQEPEQIVLLPTGL